MLLFLASIFASGPHIGRDTGLHSSHQSPLIVYQRTEGRYPQKTWRISESRSTIFYLKICETDWGQAGNFTFEVVSVPFRFVMIPQLFVSFCLEYASRTIQS